MEQQLYDVSRCYKTDPHMCCCAKATRNHRGRPNIIGLLCVAVKELENEVTVGKETLVFTTTHVGD